MTIGNESLEVETNAQEVETDPGVTVDTAVAETETTQEEEQEAPKTYTQEQIEEMFRKRMGRAERKLETKLREEFEERIQQLIKPKFDGDLSPDQFNDPEEYVEALAERKAEQKLAQIRQQEIQKQLDKAFEERAEKIRETEGFEDYDAVVGNPYLKITREMAIAIKASEVGPEVAYYLGSNPKEAARIASLNPILQAREIGKIEASVGTKPVKKVTSAPEPIKPINSRGSRLPVYDTTDPRSAETMSTEEWIEAERKRLAKKHQ